MTRRSVPELTNPKVEQVVVNMAKLEEELAPHAKGVDVALAGRSSTKYLCNMGDKESSRRSSSSTSSGSTAPP